MRNQTYNGLMHELQGAILPKWHQYSILASKVAVRLIQVTGLTHLNWELYVVNSPVPNAFILPGGKIFVHAGIFQFADSEDSLAAVLGHEIAHQIARHSSEKMSIQSALFNVQALFSIITHIWIPIADVFLQYGIMLPYSRTMESEADYIGKSLHYTLLVKCSCSKSMVCFSRSHAHGSGML